MSTRTLTFASILLFPALATAAPFCVVTGSGTNCWYYDAQSCRQAAGTAGACVVNPNEMQSGSGPPQRGGIRYGTTAPGIEIFNRNMREGDRQRAEDQAREERRFESERERQDYQRRNTDPRLLPLLGPDVELSPETRSAIMSAIFAALDMNAPGTSREWRNVQTGAYGAVSPQQVVPNIFGEPCREFSISMTINSGQTRTIAGTACRKNGQWVWPNG